MCGSVRSGAGCRSSADILLSACAYRHHIIQGPLPHFYEESLVLSYTYNRKRGHRFLCQPLPCKMSQSTYVPQASSVCPTVQRKRILQQQYEKVHTKTYMLHAHHGTRISMRICFLQHFVNNPHHGDFVMSLFLTKMDTPSAFTCHRYSIQYS